MKKITLLTILTFGFSIIFVASANAEVLNVEIDTAGGLKKIDDSKYKASAVSVLRNSDGQLISVIKTTATRYLDKSITDEFIDTLPVMKKGTLNGNNLEMTQVVLDYDYAKCLTELYEVPGYTEQCNWYHRATVTILGVNAEGQKYELFRGLNHSYSVKPLDTVTSYWTIIRSD
tara:strand:+ start:190 stop:711 length:522 start_codon:yes stop_codon:yes gene_type:complete